MIFVFGSNLAGIHGGGAAKDAVQLHGAINGQGWGPQGRSFAIPTKDYRIQTLPVREIGYWIDLFIHYAMFHPELEFQVTRIGCGLAGLKDEQVAKFFDVAPWNCYFDTKWAPHFKVNHQYWGTF